MVRGANYFYRVIYFIANAVCFYYPCFLKKPWHLDTYGSKSDDEKTLYYFTNYWSTCSIVTTMFQKRVEETATV